MIYIDDILKEKGMTKTDLTKKMRFQSRTALYNILQGNPTEENIRRLADALDVPASRLLGEEVRGYVEVKGEVHKIYSKKDLENVINLL